MGVEAEIPERDIFKALLTHGKSSQVILINKQANKTKATCMVRNH